MVTCAVPGCNSSKQENPQNYTFHMMEEENLVQQGNTLLVQLGVTNYSTPFESKTSKEYVISGAAIFQVRVIAAQVQVNNGHTNLYNNLVCVRFVKRRDDDELTYTIQFTSDELGVVGKRFTSDDGTWHLVHEKIWQQYTIDVAVTMDSALTAGSFATLHDDTELVDFELRGEDGSVRVHKAVLAAASPVLRRMFSGAWRETAEGAVDVPGTSRVTLQHLKDYLYLQVLPDTGLEQVLLLASYYMMPELEQKCVSKLVGGMTAANAIAMLEFAAKHKVAHLLLAVLEAVQSGQVQVADIHEHLHAG